MVHCGLWDWGLWNLCNRFIATRDFSVFSPECRSNNQGSSSNTLPVDASTWWRHQMETFFALLAFCAGNSAVTSEFPAQRPVTRSFDVFIDLRLDQQWSKQRRRWSFEAPSRSLWRHCNETMIRPKLRRFRCNNDVIIVPWAKWSDMLLHWTGEINLFTCRRKTLW